MGPWRRWKSSCWRLSTRSWPRRGLVSLNFGRFPNIFSHTDLRESVIVWCNVPNAPTGVQESGGGVRNQNLDLFLQDEAFCCSLKQKLIYYAFQQLLVQIWCNLCILNDNDIVYLIKICTANIDIIKPLQQFTFKNMLWYCTCSFLQIYNCLNGRFTSLRHSFGGLPLTPLQPDRNYLWKF